MSTTVLTLLSGASLGAGLMYLLDPERGERRRAELREGLAELRESDLVERARRLEPLAAVRGLGEEMGAMLERPGAWTRRQAHRAGWPIRQRQMFQTRDWTVQTRDWMILGGVIAGVAVAAWLARRAMSNGEDIEVVQTGTVEVPVERVFQFWNDFENFPRFMSHVREVRRLSDDRSRWVVAGPAGAPVEWDAVVTERLPNQLIAWRTVEGSLVEHHGSVHFRPAGPHVTLIEVRMTYRPVGGALGHGVAALLGSDPERVIGEDLARLATQLRGQRPAVGEVR